MSTRLGFIFVFMLPLIQPWKGKTFIATVTAARITQTLKGWNDIVFLLGEMVLFDGSFIFRYIIIMRRTADKFQNVTPILHQPMPNVLNINSQMYNKQHAFQPWKGETFIATVTAARITQTLKGWNDIVLL